MASIVQADCELESTSRWLNDRGFDDLAGTGKFAMKLFANIHYFHATLHFAARCSIAEKTPILVLLIVK